MSRRVFQAERRVEPRVQTDGIIGVRMHVGRRLERGVLVDINNHGAYIASSLELEKGTEMALEIEIPGSARLPVLRATVVRTKRGIDRASDKTPTGIAVKFLAETTEGRERIHLVVKTTLALDLLDDGTSRSKAVCEKQSSTR